METLGEWSDYADFSAIPAHWQKRSWVPNWLWRLVAVRMFDEA